MPSSYIKEALSIRGRKDVCARLISAIKHSGLEFQGIATCGISGAIIAPIIANALDKSLIIVRRDVSGSHAGYLVEETIREDGILINSYIIIDDLICYGNTIKRIITNIQNVKNHESMGLSLSKCVGIFLYERHFRRPLEVKYILKATLQNVCREEIPIVFTNPSDIKEQKERDDWDGKRKEMLEGRVSNDMALIRIDNSH